VWDQPTSSSSLPAAPPRGAATVARRGGRLVPGRPLGVPPTEPGNVAPMRGSFRTLRGAQQSARRSRPSSRGPMRGSPFSKGPY